VRSGRKRKSRETALFIALNQKKKKSKGESPTIGNIVKRPITAKPEKKKGKPRKKPLEKRIQKGQNSNLKNAWNKGGKLKKKERGKGAGKNPRGGRKAV